MICKKGDINFFWILITKLILRTILNFFSVICNLNSSRGEWPSNRNVSFAGYSNSNIHTRGITLASSWAGPKWGGVEKGGGCGCGAGSKCTSPSSQLGSGTALSKFNTKHLSYVISFRLYKSWNFLRFKFFFLLDCAIRYKVSDYSSELWRVHDQTRPILYLTTPWAHVLSPNMECLRPSKKILSL